MTLGERIRYCREKRGMTQQQLAEASGIHPVSIRKYETDRMEPQSKQLRRLAEALNISYASLSGTHEIGFQLNTVGDLHSILLALIEAQFFLYQDGKLRFNPLLEQYLVCRDEKSQFHSINSLSIELNTASMLFTDQPPANKNEQSKLDCQILNSMLEVKKMSIGKRIRHFRMLRGMTQKELGVAVGLEADKAANRITQYELDYRRPKDSLLNKIAEALNISPAALTVPYHTDPIDIMHILFLAEEEYGLHVELTDKKVSLHFSQPAIPPMFKNYLACWLNKEKEYQQGKLTREEYEQWKYSFCGETAK